MLGKRLLAPQVQTGKPSLKLTACPYKWMVGILLSYWGGIFSGAVLVSEKAYKLPRVVIIGLSFKEFYFGKLTHNLPDIWEMCNIELLEGCNLNLCVCSTAAVYRSEFKTLGGGFRYSLFSPRSLGRWSNLTSIFFKNGLVQPPTRSRHPCFWCPAVILAIGPTSSSQRSGSISLMCCRWKMNWTCCLNLGRLRRNNEETLLTFVNYTITTIQ